MRFSSQLRSWTGILLSLPILALILGMWACLPVPVGDPEKSKVDDKLLGIWVPEPSKDPAKADSETSLYFVQQWDAKTYIVDAISYKKDWKPEDVLEKNFHLTFKGWLTDLGGKRFLVLETMWLQPFLEKQIGNKEKDVKAWVVMQIDQKDGIVRARMIKAETELLKDVKTTQEAEKIIAAHVNDDALYEGQANGYVRAKPEQVDEIKKVLKAFHVGNL